MARTTKATHEGHCQVCGRRQKLPGGRLSDHGYTRRWGFFSGVCRGAGHKPFEQDISLIEGTILRVAEQAIELRRQADEVREKDDPGQVWYNAYFSMNRRGESGYRWIKVSIFKGDYGRWCYTHPGDDSRRGPYPCQLGIYEKDLRACARYYNEKYAAYLDKQAEERDKYVAWQLGRVEGWKLSPLIPITPCPTPSPA